MSGVRVTCLPDDISVKDIKIYFSKPENGGGKVKAIYYPLHDKAAVVLFDDRDVAEFAAREIPSGRLQRAMIEKLPVIQMYTTLTAELETPVAEFLQATPQVLEEIQYGCDITYQHNPRRNVSTLSGNWYQLEWAWKHVEDMMARQSSAHRRLASQAAMDIDAQRQPSQRETNGGKGRNPGYDSDKRKGNQPMINVPVPETAGKSSTYGAQHAKYRGRSDSSNESEESEEKDNDTDKVGGRKARAFGEESRSHRDTTDSSQQATADRSRGTDDGSEEEGDEAAGDTGARPQAAARYSKTTEILNDKPDDPRSLDFRHGPIHISIYSGNITLSESDAIVNASNEFLSHAGGVAYAIASAAGSRLVDECEKHIKDNGYLSVSDVMHTCAGGRLSPKVKYIIHAVGPIWQSGPDARSSYLLTRTFLNIMTYANKNLKIKSITMPLISSGVFGGSLEGCVQAFFKAVPIFVREHCGGGQPVFLRQINLINNNTDSTVITVTQIRECLAAMEGQLGQMVDSVVQEFNKMSLEVDIVKRRATPQTNTTDFSASVRADRYKSMPSSMEFTRSLSTSSQPSSLSSINTRSGSATDDDLDRTLGASGRTNLDRSTGSGVDQKRASYFKSVSQGHTNTTGCTDRSQTLAESRLGHMTSTGQSANRLPSTGRTSDARRETTHTPGRALPSAPSSNSGSKKK